MPIRPAPLTGPAMLALAAAAALAAAPAADAANLRYAENTIYVRLKFDGDAGFPNLTSFRNTAGLAQFTGSAFGLSWGQRNEVVNIIVTRLRARYAAFNVEFVTTNEGPSPHFTWGIDDSAYWFPTDSACASTGNHARLWGKAMNLPGDIDCAQIPIYQPRHARTWAGSFAMEGQGGVQSQPSLRLGNSLPGNVPVTVAHIAQALANNATHEIGHLFGLNHVNCEDGNGACKAANLMYSAVEGIEATHDKTFDNNYGDIDDLNRALGARIRLSLRNRGLLHDAGSGVMFTQDPNLPASVAVPAAGKPPPGGDSFSWAGAYARHLDHLGYDDWRLPNAANPDGSGPCVSRFAAGASALRTCDKSDLGRLFYRLLPWEDPGLVDGSHATRMYWSSGQLAPWVVLRNTREQYSTSTLAGAGVWPVRDAARLVDNGDGTVTDTKRGLMWIKDARLWMTHSWMQAGMPMVYAGYSDWRAPRVEELFNDYSCDVRPRTPFVSAHGCRRSEMAHLLHGWGVSAANPAPFIGLPSPLSDVPFWMSGAIPGDLNNGLTYSLVTGELRKLPRTASLPLLWVRDFAAGVPAGANVTAEPGRADAPGTPEHRVTIRFKRVTKAGTLTASSVVVTPTFPNRFTAASRTWSFGAAVAYERSDAQAVTICLRYETSELLPVVGGVGMWGPTPSGIGRMPLLPGYPDLRNQVVCAWAPYLGSVRVQSFLD